MGEREKGQDRYRQKCNHHSCFNELMLPFRWLWGSTVSPVTIVSPVRGLEMQCWVVGYCVVRQRRESCLATAVHRAWFWQSCCHSPIMVGPWVARRYLTPPLRYYMAGAVPSAFPHENWVLYNSLSTRSPRVRQVHGTQLRKHLSQSHGAKWES